MGYDFALRLGQPGAQPVPDGQGGWIDPYAQARAELAKRMAQPQAPMYSPEEVQQRRAQNAREYQLGILGQLSGDEGLGNVGGAVFKQALAQRQPHVTERGIADPLSGEFKYNPEYLREKDEAQSDKLSQLSAASQSQYYEHRRQEIARAEQAEKDRAARAELRGIISAGQAENRQARAQDKAEESRYKGENLLRTDFDRVTKTVRETIDATQKIKGTIDGYAGRKMDTFAQGAVVYMLNQFLDPGSVVREGEYERVVKAQGLEGRARLLVDNITKGYTMTPQAVQEIKALADVVEKASAGRAQRMGEQYATVARKRGYDVDSIIMDPTFRPAPVQPQQALPQSVPRPAAKPAAGGGKLPPGWGITKE